MWTIISLVFFASIIADIWFLLTAIIGVILACVAHANERRN